MKADIQELYLTDNFKLLDYRCRCENCSVPALEYAGYGAIIFIRKSGFIHSSFKSTYDAYPGVILIQKPGTEYKIIHTRLIGDECTAILFSNSFYEELLNDLPKKAAFFFDKEKFVLSVFSNPYWDLLHSILVEQLHYKNRLVKLQKDILLNELVYSIISNITVNSFEANIKTCISSYNIDLIERTKNFISKNYNNDIALEDLADYANKSSFHFGRLFKQYAGISPYQYLLQYRLQVAALYLKNTKKAVSAIAFDTGFNSKEHFSSAFTLFYNMNPVKYRNQSIFK